MVRFFPVRRCSCWHLVPRKAFILRRATPTRPGFPWSVGAHVGALFPAKPLSFVGSRQHGPDFPGPSVPMLAPCSPQSLYLSSGRANMARVSPVRRRPCWRLVPRKPLFLRQVAPTWPGFPRSTGALVAIISEKEEEKVVPRTTFSSSSLPMERVKGIEPSMRAWEARVLPLNYTRKTYSLIILQLRTAVKPFGLTAVRF